MKIFAKFCKKMPEGVECHLFARDLNTLCSGKRFTQLQICDKSRYFLKPISGFENMWNIQNNLVVLGLNEICNKVRCKGKKIIFEFENTFFFVRQV